MDFTDIKTGSDDYQRRLDKILKKIFKNHSLSEIYSFIRKGLVKVNGKKSKPEYKTESSDVLNIASFLLEKNQNSEKNENFILPYKIIFQTPDLIFIEKPYGKKVHGDNSSIDSDIKKFFALTKDSSSISFTPGPLHRLDKKTTGIITFSWSLKGAKWFSKNISNHTIQKSYIAVIQGKLKSEEIWEDFINQDEKLKTEGFYTVQISKQKISDKFKKTVTHVIPLEHKKVFSNDITIVKFFIQTGRTHQIRCQSAFHGFPLLGDTAYGGKKIFSEREFFLHAEKLIFPKDNPLNLPEELSSSYEKPLSDFLSGVKFS